MPRLLRRFSPTIVVAIALAALAVAPACSKKQKPSAAPPGSAATATTAATAKAQAGAPAIHFTVVGLEDNGTKAPDDATKAAVVATLDKWLADAVVAPLHSGHPAGDLTSLLTPAAAAKLADPAARAAFVDEGLPAASTSITADKADVTLGSVAGPDEVVAVIGARIDLKLHAVGPDLDVDVVHWGELILAPEGDGWKIDAFDLHATRDSRGAA